MLRPIVKHGERVLHRPSEPVGEFTPEIQQLIDDMIATMYAAPGVGLAAPQVGIPLRLFVVDISAGRRSGELRVCVNPEFVSRSGTQLEEEGCLSVPGFTATVLRPARAVLSCLDREGHQQVIEAQDLLARALQHEMDHLDGTTFVDRLRGIKRQQILRKIHKMKRAGRW
jgi:peptide deformylase